MRTWMWMVLVVAACGGDDNGKPSISTSASNVCGQIAEVACYDMYQCCAEGEIERLLGVTDPRTQAQCRDDVTRLCERRLAVANASIAAGRSEFDSASMNACLEALIVPDGSCATEDMVLPWADACMQQAWVGTVAGGGGCDFQFECAGDSACTSQKCVAKPSVGQPCGNGCAMGLFCDNTSGKCATLKGSGQTCQSDAQCDTSLFCDFSVPTPVCAAAKGPGEPCTSSNGCTSKTCLPGTCAGFAQSCFTDSNCTSRCEGSGQFCSTDDNCATGTCSVGGTPCNVASDCTGVGNTCVFPIKCVPGMCMGDVVCGDAIVVVDYCTNPIQDLPLPPQQ